MGGRNSGRFFVGRLLMGSTLMAGLAGAGALAVGAGAVSSTVGASSSCTASWPMFQHDASHTGAACSSAIDAHNVGSLHPAWFAPTPGAVTAEPTVANDTVYVGDSLGIFYALNAKTGADQWKQPFNMATPSNCYVDQVGPYADKHTASYGEITSSAAYVGDDANLPSSTDNNPTASAPMVYFGGGGTLYALRADTGACVWAQDVDPSQTNAASPVEVESSPVYDASTNTVIVGSDANESTGTGVGLTGMQAFDATTGAFVWKFEPQTDQTVLPATGSTAAPSSGGNDTCGDVWSSPALDTLAGPSGDGLVVFGTGNCDKPNDSSNGPITTEATWAIDATNGNYVWDRPEPDNQYESTTSGSAASADDDLGASVIIDSSLGLVIQAGKSGYVYGLNETTGAEEWPYPGATQPGTQAAEPGNLGAGPGAIGGVIGSPALGKVDGRDAVFVTSAIPAPLADGATLPNPEGGFLPNPDTSLANDPTRLASLHAIDAATGALIWHSVITTPTYSAATYSNGVVYSSSTTQFAAAAYDADTGLPLWHFPLAASAASGTSIVGCSIYLGGGIAEGQSGSIPFPPGNITVPPGANGVWSFTLAPQAPTVNTGLL